MGVVAATNCEIRIFPLVFSLCFVYDLRKPKYCSTRVFCMMVQSGLGIRMRQQPCDLVVQRVTVAWIACAHHDVV